MVNKKAFLLGCNYWASNAGAFMWKHFDEEVVRKDLKFLSEYGVNCIRIFPTWDDFQPLTKNPVPSSPFYDKFPYAMRVKEKDFLTQKYSSGLSVEKLEQFKKVLDIAKEFGIKVIVSLITGWMSGRLFVPSAFLGKDLIGDPEVVIWQCRFIKDFISELKHYDNIIAWEPGNECNALTTTAEEYACEMWMMTITNAIRLADGTRPVYSGLHNPELNGKWNLNGQSRYFDVVTTHPYPLFTRYCDIDVLREMRSSLHSAIESAYYTGITGKACLVEEAGSLGPMVISDDFTPDYFEQSLMTSLSVGTTGYLWWCSFNQEFDFAPYDINTVERNLGLAYSNENAKPILKKIKEIAPIVQEIGVLPTPRAEGVVVLPFYNDSWKIAYGSSMLAIQSGVHLDYSCEDRLLKESDHYIVPCITLCSSLSMQHLKKIEERVENGARLLITYNGGGIGDFEKITGLKVAGRKSNTNEKIFSINEKELRIRPNKYLSLLADTAKVLAKDEQGEIMLAENDYGKGKVFFLNAPLEEFYTSQLLPENTNLYEVYKLFFADKEKVLTVDSKKCMITVHDTHKQTVAVMLNNYDEKNEFMIQITNGYTVQKTLFCDIEGSKLILRKKYAYIELTRK